MKSSSARSGSGPERVTRVRHSPVTRQSVVEPAQPEGLGQGENSLSSHLLTQLQCSTGRDLPQVKNSFKGERSSICKGIKTK